METEQKEARETLWYRLWDHRSEKEKKRLTGFVPLIFYTLAFIYFCLFMSIRDGNYRDNLGGLLQNWFGGDPPAYVKEMKQEAAEIEKSYGYVRKHVAGGR